MAPRHPTPTHFSPPTSRVNGFIGQFEHQMDEKGRVSLPAAFRREADGERFVLLQWEKPYLTLFPEAKWMDVQERLLEFRRSGGDSWHRVRAVTSSAVEVATDKQGRILVPANLQQAAALSGTVLLCGNLDRVEIWDPETYRQVVEKKSGDLGQFAQKVFG